MPEIHVIKKNGTREKLDITKIQKHTYYACVDLENVSQSELEVSAHIQFQDGIRTADIQKTLVKTALDKVDVDAPHWTYVAARLTIFDLDHAAKAQGIHTLKDWYKRGMEEGRIFPTMCDGFDLDELNDYIDDTRNYQFTYLGIRTLMDRYLLKDSAGNYIETPQMLFMGVAMFLAMQEEDKNYWAKQFYDILSKFEVMSATPTLSNSRTPQHQLSSCYIGSTPDNIEGIFNTFRSMGILSKFGGGLGWDWQNIRGRGSYILKHANVAGGIVPELKIVNDIGLCFDQLGKVG